MIEANPVPPNESEQFVIQEWVEVQPGRYSYLAFDGDGGITVRIVLSEYLACEVVWGAED